jgi:hypothetical protein
MTASHEDREAAIQGKGLGELPHVPRGCVAGGFVPRPARGSCSNYHSLGSLNREEPGAALPSKRKPRPGLEYRSGLSLGTTRVLTATIKAYPRYQKVSAYAMLPLAFDCLSGRLHYANTWPRPHGSRALFIKQVSRAMPPRSGTP